MQLDHQRAPLPRRAIVIAIGNEKGGSSKSTSALHLFAALAARGLKVGVLDLDVRQLSFLRFFENREAYAARRGVTLAAPRYVALKADGGRDRTLAANNEIGAMRRAVADLARTCDAILMDCPGHNTVLGATAHAAADILVTPVGASMMDIDLIASFDAVAQAYHGPSLYTETVWQARHTREADGHGPLRWYVVLNRYTAGADVDRLRVSKHLDVLAERIGFDRLTGIAEREIYRDLWEHGLTVLDLTAAESGRASEIEAARDEVWRFVESLGIPALADLTENDQAESA